MTNTAGLDFVEEMLQILEIQKPEEVKPPIQDELEKLLEDEKVEDEKVEDELL